MEIYRESECRAIKTRVSGDAGEPVGNPWNEGMDECIFREENERGGIVLPVSVHGKPSPLDAVTSVSSLCPSLFPLSPPSLDRTCVSRTGYKRRPRYCKPQITPLPPPFPATWMCEPKTVGLHQSETFRQKIPLCPSRKRRSGWIREKDINCRLAFDDYRQSFIRLKRENVLSSHTRRFV